MSTLPAIEEKSPVVQRASEAGQNLTPKQSKKPRQKRDEAVPEAERDGHAHPDANLIADGKPLPPIDTHALPNAPVLPGSHGTSAASIVPEGQRKLAGGPSRSRGRKPPEPPSKDDPAPAGAADLTTEECQSSSETPTKTRLTSASLSPLDLLLPYQFRWVKDESKFKIGVQSRQTGKSFQTACEAVRDCLSDPGCKWVCLSAGERQALEWLEKCKEWAAAFRMSYQIIAERKRSETLLKAAEIKFTNGSRILAIPANPSTARGYSANVILDEFAYHEDPDKIWAAMFPSLTNPFAGTFLRRVRANTSGDNFSAIQRQMKIRVVSTFNGRGNKFHELWTGKEANGYAGHLVTIHDAIADGLPLNVEELRAGLNDADAWAQEYECQPTDTSNVLLPYDLIAQAESAEATEACDPELLRGLRHPRFVGIDFGRQNDPTVCWTLESIGDILWTREVLVLHQTDTPDQNEILRSRIAGAQRVVLDYTGPGIGFGDYAAKEFGEWHPEAHRFGKIDKFVFSAKSKRTLFPTLRQRFEAPTRLRVPISRDVREDLHAMQQVVTNGEYNYWAPRTKDGHSDRCTALALAIHAAGGPTTGALTAQTLSGVRIGSPTLTGRQFQPRRLG